MENKLKEMVINGKDNKKLNFLERVESIEKLTIINGILSKEDVNIIEKLNIKILQLSKLKIENLFFVSNSIEKLYLSNINFESEIDITMLKNIKVLFIYNCRNIKKLKVKQNVLEKIVINNCTVNEIEGFKTLKHIQKINLDGSIIKERVELPDIENLIFSNKKESKNMLNIKYFN